MEIVASTFKACYPHIFSSIFANESDLAKWCAIWKDIISRLDDEQITTALKKTVYSQEFPPSPAQFFKSALGIITPEQAWAAIGENKLATRAYNGIDSWFKKTASEKEVKQEFIATYKNLAERLLTEVE